MRFNILCGAAAATMALSVLATTASAAPLGAMEKNAPAAAQGQAEPVHYRDRDHCHWRNGRKFCNGGYSRRGYGPSYGYYGYNRRPGITLNLNLGGGKRHNRWR